MDFLLVFGPPAVGKMTVGSIVGERLGLPLFHNHVSIEPALRFFAYGTPSFHRIVSTFRQMVFEETIATRAPGLIFTFVWGFEDPDDHAYVEGVCRQFADAGARVWLVELVASQKVRLERNRTVFRLAEKPSKRDVTASEANLLAMDEAYVLNSPGEVELSYPYLRVETSELSAEEVAALVVEFMRG